MKRESPSDFRAGDSIPAAALARTSRCYGLFRRREMWVPSRLGWITLLLLCVGCGLLFMCGVHPFLALTSRVDTEYLVVEGWVPNYALEESLAEFRSKPYRRMFTVGCGILNGVGLDAGDNDADYALSRLKWMGMDIKLVQPVVAHIKHRNRTYQSAVALREWIEDHHLPVERFNLVTVGPHARRSRLLFEKAFQGRAQVGIISVEDREYDPKRWWKCSEGVKEILSEGAAYLYVRLAFWP